MCLFVFFYQIQYIDDVQLSFLRMLHTKARQKFSYLCQNSAAWYDQISDSYASALTLMGDNEFEIETKKLAQKHILSDGCRVS